MYPCSPGPQSLVLHVGNLISGSSAFSKTSLNIWKFLVHVLLKPSLKEFEQALGDDKGQGSLPCCSPWGHKELDTT